MNDEGATRELMLASLEIECRGEDELLSEAQLMALKILPIAVHTSAMFTLIAIQAWAIY